MQVLPGDGGTSFLLLPTAKPGATPPRSPIAANGGATRASEAGGALQSSSQPTTPTRSTSRPSALDRVIPPLENRTPPRPGKVSPKPPSGLTELRLIDTTLTLFQKKIDDCIALFAQAEGALHSLLGPLEYLSINKSSLQKLLVRFDQTKEAAIASTLFQGNEGYKWANCTMPLMLFFFKALYFSGRQSELLEEGEKLRKITPQGDVHLFATLEGRVRALEEALAIEIEEAKSMWQKKLLKGIAKAGACLMVAKGVEVKTADNVSRCVYQFFRNLMEMWHLARVWGLQDQWRSDLQRESENRPVIAKLKRALLKKHAVERKVIAFRAAQATAGMCLATVQFALINPTSVLPFNHPVLKLLTADLSRMGHPALKIVYLCYPLYPTVSLKVDNLLMQVIDYLFMRLVLPSEYSLRSYRLTLEKRCLQLLRSGASLLYRLKFALLWIRVCVLERMVCFSRADRKAPLEALTMRWEQENERIRQKIASLSHSLANMEMEDAKATIETPEEKELIQSVVRELKGVDIKTLPEVSQFFRQHFSFTLTNESVQEELEGYLSDFFCRKEVDFIESYRR